MNLTGLDTSNPLGVMESVINQNNAWSAEQAEKQMQFQREMSNTAHQREIEDLKAAGLNPVLSAQTQGASTPTGAKAEATDNFMGALVDLLSQSIQVNSVGSALGAMENAGDNKIAGKKGLGAQQIKADVQAKPTDKGFFSAPNEYSKRFTGGKEDERVHTVITEEMEKIKGSHLGKMIPSFAAKRAESVAHLMADLGIPFDYRDRDSAFSLIMDPGGALIRALKRRRVTNAKMSTREWELLRPGRFYYGRKPSFRSDK